MEVQGTKRIIDPDDEKDVPSRKKARYELRQDIKDRIIQFFALSYWAFFIQFMSELNQNNVSISIQLMDIVHTAYDICRQEGSGIVSRLRQKARREHPNVEHKGHHYPVNIDEAISTMKQVAIYMGLSFAQERPAQDPSKEVDTQDPSTSTTHPEMATNNAIVYGNEWFGIAEPYCYFLTGFSLRLKELRLGHSEFHIKTEGAKSTSYPLSKFGLSGRHYILLEGIGFPPERRSSMAQYLGPMTNLLCYLMSPTNYDDKFEDACKMLLSHIPNIEMILKTIKGQPISRIRNIISLIADIKLIVTPGQNNKASPPPCAFFYMCTEKAHLQNIKSYIKRLYGKEKKINIHDQSSVFGKKVSMSGLNTAILYHEASKLKYQLNGIFNTSEASQIIFHCWWGTFKEDLGILSAITTTQDWFKRAALGNKFQKMNTQNSVTENISLPSLLKFSNLSSANETGRLAQGAKQVASIPVSGGVSHRKFTNDFFQNLEKQSPSGTGSLTIEGIEADLTIILRELIQKLKRKQGIQETGTALWYDIPSNATVDIYNRVVEPIPAQGFMTTETGDYFLG